MDGLINTLLAYWPKLKPLAMGVGSAYAVTQVAKWMHRQLTGIKPHNNTCRIIGFTSAGLVYYIYILDAEPLNISHVAIESLVVGGLSVLTWDLVFMWVRHRWPAGYQAAKKTSQENGNGGDDTRFRPW